MVSSVPAAMLPVPLTVDCTTPCSAVTISLDVRAELVGGPISVIASTATAMATTASTYRNQGLGGRSRRVLMRPAIRYQSGRRQALGSVCGRRHHHEAGFSAAAVSSA